MRALWFRLLMTTSFAFILGPSSFVVAVGPSWLARRYVGIRCRGGTSSVFDHRHLCHSACRMSFSKAALSSG